MYIIIRHVKYKRSVIMSRKIELVGGLCPESPEEGSLRRWGEDLCPRSADTKVR